jgi:S-adenosylmethionine:tRNA ribosyltransferase-isomerase
MMVIERSSGAIYHDSILSLPDRLRNGDLLVVNNTKVLPARIFTTKEATGGRVELLLLHRDPAGTWTALAKPAKSIRAGTWLSARAKDGGESIRIAVVENRGEGEISIRFQGDGDRNLDRIGIVPLPPYIREPMANAERYQTLYAQIPGSAAAPTAGLHITDRLRQDLFLRGIGWAEVTLHIGLDTFRPVTVESVRDHKIHREWCSVPADVAKKITETKAGGNRIVAVGTTSARTLEMWASTTSMSALGFEGYADLFITPGYVWSCVDAMLTNFHLPRSTLLMMVCSFAGIDLIRSAYGAAVNERYRFFSFGDAMLMV